MGWEIAMKTLRAALLLAIPAVISACATPTLQSPTTDPVAVAREAAVQRKFVVERMKAQRERVSRVMFRLSVGAADMCKDHITGTFGLAGMTAQQFGAQESVARSELGFDDGLTVTAVFPGSPAESAGLKPGDRIVSFGNKGLVSSSAMQTYLISSARNQHAVPIQFRRHGEMRATSATPLLACSYPAIIQEDNIINAYADGEQVIITTGMLNFAASDSEFAVVASHELSHNILDHLGKQRENRVVGGALGLAVDVLVIATTGVNPGLYRMGEQLGARAYSVEFEKEADYQGLYVMRRGGYNIEEAANIWRRFAAENPTNISIRSTHPTTPERFLAMNTAIAEIDAKEVQHLALAPNLKAGSENQSIAIASSAPAGPAIGLAQSPSLRNNATVVPVSHSAFSVPAPNYTGDLKNGMKAGHGTATYADGSKYVGEFKDDTRAGHGVWTGNGGDRYEGEWANDKRNGFGIFTDVKGNVSRGTWQDGELIKPLTVDPAPAGSGTARSTTITASKASSSKATRPKAMSAIAAALSAASPPRSTPSKPAITAATLSPASSAVSAATCTHEQQVQARIAKMNGYTAGPKCD
jgi:hypothetical protein